MIRRATAGDAAGIARVQAAAWMSAYAGFIDPSKIAAKAENGLERWTARVASDRALTWVACDEAGEVLGFVAAGRADETDLPSEQTGCLFALYVDPERWSRGVGRGLLECAVEWMRGEGWTQAVLWVLVGNGRARAFYAKAGWRPEPHTVENDPMFWDAPTLRYRREL